MFKIFKNITKRFIGLTFDRSKLCNIYNFIRFLIFDRKVVCDSVEDIKYWRELIPLYGIKLNEDLTDLSHCFENFETTEDNWRGLRHWDTSEVTNFSHMFENSNIPFIAKLNTRRAVNMSYMYANTKMTHRYAHVEVKLNRLLYADGMFKNSKVHITLLDIDAPNLISAPNIATKSNIEYAFIDVPKCTTLTEAFKDCRNIKSITIYCDDDACIKNFVYSTPTLEEVYIDLEDRSIGKELSLSGSMDMRKLLHKYSIENL